MSTISRIFPWAIFLLVASPAVLAEDSPTIDNDEKAVVVTKVATIMTERYFDLEVGQNMALHIQSRHKAGAYDDHAEIRSFCSALTSDLRSISNDKHLFVFHSPEEAREVGARMKLLPTDEIEEIEQQHYEADRRENFGFQKVEILDGNVGYLKLQYFAGDENGAEEINHGYHPRHADQRM